MEFYIDADIEYDPNCALDYLQIQTDSNDGNWINQGKYCNYYDQETLRVNLANAKSNTTRFRFVWVTNSSDIPHLFFNTPFTPYIDDVILNNLNSSYGIGYGTSFAAPYVSGASAMVFGKFTTYSAIDVKNKILNSGDAIPNLFGKTVSGKRLNLTSALQPWPNSPVYRFWSSAKQGHFFTSSLPEKESILASDASWSYEGVAFSAYTNNTTVNATPIYRFWSNAKQHHFYTASLEEKNFVIANDPSWAYESIAYYAYATEMPSTTPVYRFWSDKKQGHFFTTNAAEKASIIANDRSWAYEGIAWYVPTN